MMKKALIGVVAVISALAMPAATFAATYEYVNVTGVIETESATDAAQALVQPTDRAANSGVILAPTTAPTLTPGDTVTSVTGTDTTGTMGVTSTGLTPEEKATLNAMKDNCYTYAGSTTEYCPGGVTLTASSTIATSTMYYYDYPANQMTSTSTMYNSTTTNP